jgi:Ecdysteroid kinase-like family
MNIPSGPGDITPELVTAWLRDSGHLDGTAVTSVAPEPLFGRGLTGNLFRLRLTYDAQPGGGPPSVVAKFSAADPEARAVIHSMGFYEREVRFYTELADEIPVRTPRCFYGAVDTSNGESLLLLEDLAQHRNLDSFRCSVEDLGLVLRDVATLHAAWWQRADLHSRPWLAMRGMLTAEQVPPMVLAYWPPFLTKLGVPVTEEILAVARYAERYLAAITTYTFHEPPLTLVHHDLQGDNLFVADGPAEAVVIVDWQLVTPARAALDVAECVVAHLDPEDRRIHEKALLGEYHATLVAGGVTEYSLEDCWDDYRIAMLLPATRLAAAIGMHPGLTATPSASWDTIFPRFARAMAELRVSDLLQRRFG